MLLIGLIISVFCLTIVQSQKNGGSCLTDLDLGKNSGCCTSNSTCCIGDICCCDQNCYDFGDCCLDVWALECPPRDDQTPIPESLYTCADVYGTTEGCCTSDCRKNEQICYCDQDCYHNNDCCEDIMDIGCKCNFTCSDHFGNVSGCCIGENCGTSCCFCDEDCYSRGDCCMDIESWGCLELTPDPTIGYCPEDSTFQSNFNMSWSKAPPGMKSYQTCSLPRIGNASRTCYDNGTWGLPNVENCQLSVLSNATTQIDNLHSSNADEIVEGVSSITAILINITSNPQTHNNPNDVKTVVQVITDSILLLQTTIGDVNNSNPFLELGYLDVFNNLLEGRYKDSFIKIGNITGGSSDLLLGYEEYLRYIAMFQNEYEDEALILEKTRLAISTASDIRGENDIKFPMKTDFNIFDIDANSEGFPEIVYSREELENLYNSDGKVTIVNSFIKNIAEYLHDDFERDQTEVGSIVLSSVVVTSTQTVNIPAVLNITTKQYYNKRLENSKCAFWDSTKNGGFGQWSTEGINVIGNTSIAEAANLSQIVTTCISYHQTPFCVLVDVHGIQYNPGEEYALEVISYIGVSISIFFLILTIIFLMFLGKQLVLSTQYFIHFNLSIALLGGYITFLFFVDERIVNVTNSTVGCAIVAAVLQFFFTAAFSWMMCEGIMLFLLLVVVFTSIGKRWYLFLIIGWGVPIIPVAISSGLIYKQYGSPGRHCWIELTTGSNAIWAFVAPMLIIISVNIFFLIMSVRALILYHQKKQQDQDDKKASYLVFKKSIIGTLTLLPLFGITWVIGLFAVDENTTVFAWLFVVLNSLQGAFIFFFNIVRNERIRESIEKRCCPKRKKMKRSKSASIAKRSNSFTYGGRPLSQQFLMTTPSTKATTIDEEHESSSDENPDISVDSS